MLRHLSTACIYWCIGSCSSWLCLQQLALSCSLRPSAWPLYEQNGLLCTKTWQSRSAPRRVDEPANDLFWHNVKLDSSVLCYHVRNVLYQLCIFSWMYITYSVDRYLFFNNTLLHNLAIIAVLLSPSMLWHCFPWSCVQCTCASCDGDGEIILTDFFLV